MPSPAGLADKLAEAFTAKTGVEVEQFQGTTGEILARLEAEQANPVADVVILASWSDGLSIRRVSKNPFLPCQGGESSNLCGFHSAQYALCVPPDQRTAEGAFHTVAVSGLSPALGGGLAEKSVYAYADPAKRPTAVFTLTTPSSRFCGF